MGWRDVRKQGKTRTAVEGLEVQFDLEVEKLSKPAPDLFTEDDPVLWERLYARVTIEGYTIIQI